MNNYGRKLTREVKIGNVLIGGNNPVAIQSMCNTDTRDVEKTVEQIKRLEDAGCEIVRVAVPDMEAAKAVGEAIAKKALEKGIKAVVFDRGGYVYHGRVAALAEGAREGGLDF